MYIVQWSQTSNVYRHATYWKSHPCSQIFWKKIHFSKLKGTVAWYFCRLFSSNRPSWSNRTFLKPFGIVFSNSGVIKVLKWIPGIWDTGELRVPGVQDSRESRSLVSQIPGILNFPSSGIPGSWESSVSGIPGSGESSGVLDTGELPFDCSLFFPNFKLLLQLLK